MTNREASEFLARLGVRIMPVTVHNGQRRVTLRRNLPGYAQAVKVRVLLPPEVEPTPAWLLSAIRAYPPSGDFREYCAGLGIDAHDPASLTRYKRAVVLYGDTLRMFRADELEVLRQLRD